MLATTLSKIKNKNIQNKEYQIYIKDKKTKRQNIEINK
jgi:hypothetical protein